MFPVRRAFFLSALASGLFLPIALPAQTPTQSQPQSHTQSHTTAPVRRRVVPAGPVLPKNIPPVKAPVKVEFALRYQDITVGAGDLAAPGQFYSVNYTGWLATDGTKFDSSFDHGKPIEFQQGIKRVILGWDQGFEGMRVGGKRRLFIPYQLAYGEAGRGPIPPKADLIFDIELVAQRDPNAPEPPSPPAQ